MAMDKYGTGGKPEVVEDERPEEVEDDDRDDEQDAGDDEPVASES